MPIFVNTDTIALVNLAANGDYALVTRTGTLRNNNAAIVSSGVGTTITNNGEILSVSTSLVVSAAAIYVSGGFADIVNNGLLVSTAGYALGVENAGARLFNAGSVVGDVGFLSAATSLVNNIGTITGKVEAGFTASLNLYNGGTISALSIAVGGGGLDDRITNAGRIIGEVTLLDGDDLYDGVLGTVSGFVGGGAGHDTLLGGAGRELISGGDGDDSLDGGAGADTLQGDGGQDELRGGDGDDVLRAGTDAAGDLLDGGTGFDLVDFRGTGAGFRLDLAAPADNTGAAEADVLLSIEGAFGGSGGDTLLGSAAINEFHGMAGNDSLDGRGGNDTLRGGDGNDLYRVDAFGDLVVERAGRGFDLVLTTVTYRLAPGWEVEALYADIEDPAVAAAALNLTGSNTANDIVGTNGANRLLGRGGTDTLNGLAGNDTLNGGLGNDSLLGAAGNDSLLGDAGRDTLDGGAETDRLAGGEAADLLTGGAGSDFFRFEGAFGLGFADRITDFDPAQDTIQLAQGTFTALSPGPLPAAALELGVAAATNANTRILAVPSLDLTFLTLRYDPDGSGPGASFAFGILDGLPALTAADFVVVV